jgi:hypothetical protein
VAVFEQGGGKVRYKRERENGHPNPNGKPWWPKCCSSETSPRSALIFRRFALEAVPLVVEMRVRLLTDIVAPFRVGIQPLRTLIRSLPKIGIVRRPSTPVASASGG